MRRVIALTIITGAYLWAVPVRIGSAADRPARHPTSRPASAAQGERLKWESRIIFYGDEASGEWSLRIRDQDVEVQHDFRLRELWTFDRDTKRWAPMGTQQITATMLPVGQKLKNPNDPEADPVQILANLPIEKDQMGLFYAKWSVDSVKGSTYFRIGPGLKEKTNPILHQKPPDGKIIAIIPIDISHAEAAFIPDPRVACELDE